MNGNRILSRNIELKKTTAKNKKQKQKQKNPKKTKGISKYCRYFQNKFY